MQPDKEESKDAEKVEINTQDLYSLQPYPNHVSQESLVALIAQAKQFHSQYQSHKQNIFFESSQYYIVSKKWLERWKVYTSYNEIINEKPPSKLQGCGKMPELNEDIVDKNWKSKLEFREQKAYLNISLKEGLSEQRDFVFMSQGMWQVIRHYYGNTGIQILRKVVETNEGKKVEIYLQKITAILLFPECLKLIERENLTKLVEVNFQVSRYWTIDQVQQNIKYRLKEFLALEYSSKFNYGVPLRFWLLPTDTRRNILMNTLAVGCKANPSFSYKLFIDAQFLESQSLVSDCDFTPDSLLAIELKEDKEQWVFFNNKKPLQAPCSCCRAVKLLDHLCSCKFAAYCSRQCKYRDKSHHKFRCPNDGESDQEEKELVQNQNSRRGITGLRNLGNTCFMNSGLQCLSNVPLLTKYFLDNNYINQINKDNPLGTKGELSINYAKMIRSLWFGRQSSFSPTQLKRAIGKFQPMFSGYNQHDSGQLVTYLLDGLHEDLNRVIKKPYVESKDYDGREDWVVAKQSWQNFLKRNQSVIVDLMYGQYRSVVDCPTCNYESIQFDPFLMCSLPIVNTNTKKIQLKFIIDHIKMRKLTILYEKAWNWTMQDVLKEVAKKLQIFDPSKLFAYVASYASCQIISLKRTADEVRKEFKYRTIYIRELLDGEDPEKDVKIILSNTVCHSYYNDQSYRKSLTAYRMYFISKEITCKQLHHKIIGYYKEAIQVKDYQTQVIQMSQKQQPFRILLIPASRYSTCDYCKKKNCDGCMLPYNDTKFLDVLGEESKIEMELYWRKNISEVEKIFDEKQEDEKGYSKQQSGTTIQECFKLFSQPQILAQDNAWYCPKCKQFVLAKKQMQIYKAPQILMLCLKRFKRKQYSQQKLSILVQFPLEGLDLTEFVINPDLPQDYQKQPIKIDGHQPTKPKIIYDLIGITNHMGGTGGGHYTAYCKNQLNNQWYNFDDSYVDKVTSKHQLVSQSAYVLFYQRRKQ